MPDILIERVLTVIFSLISAGLLGFCKYLWDSRKNYKRLLEEKETDNVEVLIDQKLQPILDMISENGKQIQAIQALHSNDMKQILQLHLNRLEVLCEKYLSQNYMTPEQYMELQALFNIYKNLGGNGRVEELYKRTISVQIVDR